MIANLRRFARDRRRRRLEAKLRRREEPTRAEKIEFDLFWTDVGLCADCGGVFRHDRHCPTLVLASANIGSAPCFDDCWTKR